MDPIKKKFVIIILVAGGALASIFFLFSLTMPNYSNSFASTSPQPEISPRPDEWANTAVYTNEKYGYRITYPSVYLSPILESEERISFSEDDLPSRIVVQVEPTSYISPEQWLDAENEKMRSEDKGLESRRILEKRITIAGREAIVTYHANKIEKFPEEKTTVFIKNGYLFRLLTSYIDHQRIWRSVEFQ